MKTLRKDRGLTTYTRLRHQCAALFRPDRLIRSVRLHHQQVYEYGIHRGALAATLDAPQHRRLAPIAGFLEEMVRGCPHNLFQSDAGASRGQDAVQSGRRGNQVEA